jgi:Fe-S-cluster containining protein
MKLPSCIGCGKCCRLEVELVVGLDDQVPEKYIEWRKDRWPYMKQTPDGWCVCFDQSKKLCSIYPLRPKACLDFERGGLLCRELVNK